MGRIIEDLDLKYLNGRINRLSKKFRDSEDAVYSWKKKDREDIDKLLEIAETTGENKK